MEVSDISSNDERSGSMDKDAQECAQSSSACNTPHKERLAGLLPMGRKLTAVNGVEFEEDLISDVLQLTEFFHAFSKLLGLEPGQVQNLLKELKGGALRRQNQSILVQLHVRLLKVICSTESNECIVTTTSSGKDSWLAVLSEHLTEHTCPPISWSAILAEPVLHERGSSYSSSSGSDLESQNDKFKDLKHGTSDSKKTPSEAMEDARNGLTRVSLQLAKGAEGYTELRVREKLEILNLLCDDALDTDTFRDYIEANFAENEEKQKENREVVAAARKEAKEAKESRRTQDEISKTLQIASLQKKPRNDEAALRKHRRNLEDSRRKLENANSKVLAVTRSKGRLTASNSLHTKPLLVDPFGRSFWRLNIIHRGLQTVMRDLPEAQKNKMWDTTSSGGCGRESWMIFSEEATQTLEAYLAACREGQRRRRKKSAIDNATSNAPINKGGFEVFC